MRAQRRLAAVAAACAVLAAGACSDDGDEGEVGATTASTAPEATTTTGGAAPSSTSTTAPEDTAGDPLDAAEAFLTTFLPGTAPVIGEFQAGDSQSGEVEVYRPAEGGGTSTLASVLLLRVVDGEWQVIGAVNPNVSIESPANGAEVDAGPLVVHGMGRGFEAHIGVRAMTLDGEVVAEGFGNGGAFAEPEPYEVTVDLAGTAPATELVLVVAGGTGLERDPGEFSAIRITT